MYMKEQLHIYTPRKSEEIIEEVSTFKHQKKVNEPDLQPNTCGITHETNCVIYV
jgi:hypothetical protein